MSVFNPQERFPEAMHIMLALALLALLFVYVSYRLKPYCKYCQTRHGAGEQS